ncbi:MAG: helix-turn-helix transcriptional regulator [Gemmataceae bacterium]|nr:helix-turn-helix domain-containing protein [Gemmata sp.]MDW8197272.1 helix-turn-helix transcriptional regulator [Gemmataceae bacterium]
MGLSKNIAYRLRTLREAAGLSQQEVAERADLSLSLITKIEQARKADPRASTLIALAEALGVRPGQLIDDLVPPPDGMFSRKSKKDKKKKKKKKKQQVEMMAAVVAPRDSTTATTEPPSTGETLSLTKPPKKKKKKT